MTLVCCSRLHYIAFSHTRRRFKFLRWASAIMLQRLVASQREFVGAIVVTSIFAKTKVYFLAVLTGWHIF